jgi:hypothetical protein
MNKRRMTRREAIAGLSKIAAIMAGAQGLAKGDLSAMTWRLPLSAGTVDLNKIAGIKALSNDARVIKILLIPRQDIFISEFGRVPGGLTKNQSGALGCDFLVQSVIAGGCDQQVSGSMESCDTHYCDDFNCGQYGGCNSFGCGRFMSKLGEATCEMHTQIFSTGFLNRIIADPFIQALMKQLNVTTSSALSTELEKMLTVRKQIIR